MNGTASVVVSCWTYASTSTNDDVYCRSRATGSATWTGSIITVANSASVEDHGTVVANSDGSFYVVYHDGGGAGGSWGNGGLYIKLYDSSGSFVSGTRIGIGVADNWPHLINAGGTLHLTWFGTASNTVGYASCSSGCTTAANWTSSQFTPTDTAEYPQVAVGTTGQPFIAYTGDPAIGTKRVFVTTKCAGTWSTTGMRVDDTESTEMLGGEHPIHAYPALSFDGGTDAVSTTDDRLHVVYTRKDDVTNFLEGVWSRDSPSAVCTAVCGGAC